MIRLKYQNPEDICVTENSSHLRDKFSFVLEASRRSNAICLQLFSKENEAYPGESVASSIISRYQSDHGSFMLSSDESKVLFSVCSFSSLESLISECWLLFLVLVPWTREAIVCLERSNGKSYLDRNIISLSSWCCVTDSLIIKCII